MTEYLLTRNSVIRAASYGGKLGNKCGLSSSRMSIAVLSLRPFCGFAFNREQVLARYSFASANELNVLLWAKALRRTYSTLLST